MGDSPQTIEDLFHRALAADGEDARAAVLASADAADRARLLSLLASHEASIGFFKIAADPPPALDLGGTQIGAYRISHQIGEGGFAVVYAAEQTSPVRRPVALKVIKPGMDSRQVISRFNAERQALAVMDHPNIAKVFDAGTTDAGRPYFVMELVPDGRPITAYCDEHRLSIPERLALFADVCAAVQHAHQKGIIHRDIKPTNVLVTVPDARPAVKVIDFGVAKATTSLLPGQTLFTEFGQLVGTPEYMSPEQAAGRAADVDTRSDLYSLGVLLYELLAGATPFGARALRDKALAEIQHVIREVEPPRPSTRLTDSRDTLASVAAVRRVEPDRLTRLLRGELDWVVMKCLEKDPDRRYESAAALGADLAAYLRQEAVAARPPGGLYRARKLVRRHRIPFTAGAVVAVTLVVALAVSVRLLIRERYALGRAVDAQHAAERARSDEAAQRLRAQNHLARAREIAQLVRLLGGSESRQSVRANAIRQEVMEKIAANLESLTADTADDAASAAQLADAYYNAVIARRELNQPAEAKRLCLAAIDRLRAAADRVPDELRYRQRLADYYFTLYEITRDQGERAEQASALREALAQERTSYERNRDDAGDASHYAWLLTMCARSFAQLRQPAEALAYARDGAALQEELLAKHPDDVARARHAADAQLQYGVVLEQAGRYPEAAEHFRRCVVLNRQYLAVHTADVEATARLAEGLEYLAAVACRLGRLDEAESSTEEEASLIGPSLARQPDRLDLHERLLYSGRTLGYLRWRQGRHDDAARAYADARAAAEWLVDAAPNSDPYKRARLALLVESAEPSARDPRRAVELAGELLRRMPRDGRLLARLADACYQSGDVRSAREAMARARAGAADFPLDAGTLYLEAILQHKSGEPVQAAKTFAEAEAEASRERPLFWESLHADEARALLGAASPAEKSSARETTAAPISHP